ncbi:MAG: GMC family oxidoreductase [Asgard group archaeon]|nr:GMC family oxidoreductase [Asgard group archaeon]
MLDLKKTAIKKYEYVVVGTGPGGATIAQELSKANKSVAILEYGNRYTKKGQINVLTNIYLNEKLGLKYTSGNISIGRARMLGGSSYFAQGNAVTPPDKIFREWGINLKDECASAREDMRVKLMPENLIGEGTKRLIEGAKSLGYEMKLTPKCVDFTKCKQCGKCAYGCPQDAKWTTIEFVDSAVTNGADLYLNSNVTKVKHGSGDFNIVYYKHNGSTKEIIADKIIISAGALETPRILQNSGIEEAGKGIALDIFQTTYGYTKDVGMKNEMILATYIESLIEEKELFPAPYMYPTLSLVRDIADFVPGKMNLVNMIKGLLKARKIKAQYLLGMMTKVRDEITGEVKNDGTVVKEITEKDQKKLDEAYEINRDIILASGADPKSIIRGYYEAGHPCCTAPIGKVLDKNQQTEIEGVFVSDASVFPSPLGLPPILTIVALSKRLANYLLKN